MAKDAAMRLTRQGHGGVYHGILGNQDNIHDMMMTDNLDENGAMQLTRGMQEKTKIGTKSRSTVGMGGTSCVLIFAPDKVEAADPGHRPANNHEFYKLELLGVGQPRAVCALSY